VTYIRCRVTIWISVSESLYFRAGQPVPQEPAVLRRKSRRRSAYEPRSHKLWQGDGELRHGRKAYYDCLTQRGATGNSDLSCSTSKRIITISSARYLRMLRSSAGRTLLSCLALAGCCWGVWHGRSPFRSISSEITHTMTITINQTSLNSTTNLFPDCTLLLFHRMVARVLGILCRFVG
jgi:hypothetical protein